MKSLNQPFSRTIPLVFFMLFLISCQKETVSERPNIVFILADDLGYYDLSCMGSRFYETPHIDRIANEGVVFTNGYATCQVCSPSRASIMTGQFPARHGITDWIGAPVGEDWRKNNRHNKLLPPDYVRELPSELTTLPEALKAGGYKTFFAGKWHLGGEGSWPEDHGFDVNIGGWDSGGPTGGYFSPWKNPNLENRQDGENLSMRLARETVSFLENNLPDQTGQPVFAFLSFYAVHGPIQTTQEKWAKFRDKADAMGIAEKGFEMGRFLPIRQVQDNPVYAGLVSAMDDAVGLVLNALDSLGLSQNTIVVFTSDNGGVSAGDSFSTAVLPFRGGKGYQYEGGIREPYFIKVPGVTKDDAVENAKKAGKTISTPVTGTDFYPTLLELAGQPLKPEEHLDGISLVPLLNGETLPERPLIWHYPHYGNQGGEPSSMIRLGDWKLIHYYEDSRNELYNLSSDPYEGTNLSAEEPEQARKLHEMLFSFLKSTGAAYPEPDPEYDEEKERKHLANVRNNRLPNLEKQRMEYLSPQFDPGNNWWGSEIPRD